MRYSNLFDTIDDLDAADLMPHLSRLNQKVTRLEAASGNVGLSDADLGEIAELIERLQLKINRVAGKANQLQRAMQRQRDNDQLPAEQKRRTPRVVKTATADPFAGDFIGQAQAALALGHYSTWAAQCRQKLAEAAAVA